jgi:hypothetical protein
MSPSGFFRRWSAQLSIQSRDQFLLELATLLALEQARERRRLCTDVALYRKACEATAAELDMREGLGATA